MFTYVPGIMSADCILFPTVTRHQRCRNCPGFKMKDCGKFKFCKDNLKFGGLGRMKKSCISRSTDACQLIAVKLCRTLCSCSTCIHTNVTMLLSLIPGAIEGILAEQRPIHARIPNMMFMLFR